MGVAPEAPRVASFLESKLPTARTGGFSHGARVVPARRGRVTGELYNVVQGILFNLCGHGHFDLAAFEQYLAGILVDLEPPEEEIKRVVARVSG